MITLEEQHKRLALMRAIQKKYDNRRLGLFLGINIAIVAAFAFDYVPTGAAVFALVTTLICFRVVHHLSWVRFEKMVEEVKRL